MRAGCNGVLVPSWDLRARCDGGIECRGRCCTGCAGLLARQRRRSTGCAGALAGQGRRCGGCTHDHVRTCHSCGRCAAVHARREPLEREAPTHARDHRGIWLLTPVVFTDSPSAVRKCSPCCRVAPSSIYGPGSRERRTAGRLLVASRPHGLKGAGRWRCRVSCGSRAIVNTEIGAS